MLLYFERKRIINNSLHNDNLGKSVIKGHVRNKAPITITVAPRSCLPKKFRRQNVLNVHRKLKEGQYGIDEK
jgi:hypothetical protein